MMLKDIKYILRYYKIDYYIRRESSYTALIVGHEDFVLAERSKVFRGKWSSYCTHKSLQEQLYIAFTLQELFKKENAR